MRTSGDGGAFEILVVNAAHIKKFGDKTDVTDAEWLADLLRHGLLRGSFIPSAQQRWTLHAFVIMPTHFHLIIKPSEGQTITTNLQSLGSFTAHAILKQLRAQHMRAELDYFATHRQADPTEKHQVWQPLQAKNVFSVEFLREKVEYIHNNPIAKHWALVDNRADYRYSSACYYDRGKVPVVEVDDVRQWLV